MWEAAPKSLGDPGRKGLRGEWQRRPRPGRRSDLLRLGSLFSHCRPQETSPPPPNDGEWVARSLAVQVSRPSGKGQQVFSKKIIMAQVKVQTTTSNSGPTLIPATLAPSVTATSSVGLQPSLNGSVPKLAVDCNNSVTGLVDCNNLQVPFQDNMANPKEKTPMCLVNELARFNRIQPLYKLLNERGPAHAKMFTVQLTLGEQTWEAEGSSIKKAHHSAASKALSETALPKPAPRPPKNNANNNPGIEICGF
uniref:Uncharacterized protein n=1 Tax=Sphaerodactylus townsendi TaxID=933632 RepID=A0ACB8FE26_9SAUR